jgi:hypothetical protein
MTDPDREGILGTAKAINPNIGVFQAKKDAEGRISFDAV